MLLVLDSNEFIFTFGEEKYPPSKELLDCLTSAFPEHPFRICETIVNEVRHNIIPEAFHDFVLYVRKFTAVDSDFLVPAELFAKHQRFLKPGDAFIASYAEWVGAGALVSENRRHFHTHKALFPFHVWDAATCVRQLRKSS